MKERIQELRLWLNLSQNEFASAIGISASALSSLINGHNNPSLKLVTSIKKAYPQVSTDWLLLGTGSMLESDGKGDSPANPQPTQTLAQPSVSQPVQGVLFDTPRDTVAEKIANPPTPTPQSRFQRPLVKDVSVAKNSDKPQRCIKQVIIIYDDGTSQTINSNT
jgi:DNA-binding XRE family transcriptional regulator